MTAPWQRGFDLAELRSFAAVFAARHKSLVFGAFGLTKERDIADAVADGNLLFKRDPGGAPVACAILRRLANAGGFTDFAGREFRIPAGHVRCQAFAAISADAGEALLNAMRGRSGGCLWVELFEEDEIARAAIARVAGLQYAATRIAAGSEVKGIYSDAASAARPPLDPAEGVALAVLDPRFASGRECAAMLAEIAAFAANPWVQHYSSYNLRKSWTAFSLRGYDATDPGYIVKPAEMAKGWQAEHPERMAAPCEWTKAVPAFPETMRHVERILAGRRPERVRLMKLAPRGELSRHADITNRDAGLADGRLARVHLPLRTSPGVVMHGWGKRGGKIEVAFPQGALCYLDQRGPHRVENRDPNLERVHLVIDMASDRALRAQIAAAGDGLSAVA